MFSNFEISENHFPNLSKVGYIQIIDRAYSFTLLA